MHTNVEKAIALLEEAKRYGFGGYAVDRVNQAIAVLQMPAEQSELAKHIRAMLPYSDISDSGKTHLENACNELDRLTTENKQLTKIIMGNGSDSKINEFMEEWKEFLRVCHPSDSSFNKALRIIVQLQTENQKLRKAIQQAIELMDADDAMSREESAKQILMECLK